MKKTLLSLLVLAMFSPILRANGGELFSMDDVLKELKSVDYVSGIMRSFGPGTADAFNLMRRLLGSAAAYKGAQEKWEKTQDEFWQKRMKESAEEFANAQSKLDTAFPEWREMVINLEGYIRNKNMERGMTPEAREYWREQRKTHPEALTE